MANALLLDLVTPEEQRLSKEVDMVVVPGRDGDIGVLAGHSPVIASIKPGVVRVYDGKGDLQDRYFVTGGFIEVTNERCTVLATEIYDYKSQDKERIKKRQEAAQKAHKAAQDEADRIAAEAELEISQALVDEFVSKHSGVK